MDQYIGSGIREQHWQKVISKSLYICAYYSNQEMQYSNTVAISISISISIGIGIRMSTGI
jgi:hypothetical protein